MITRVDWQAVARNLAAALDDGAAVFARVVSAHTDYVVCGFCQHPECDGNTHKAAPRRTYATAVGGPCRPDAHDWKADGYLIDTCARCGEQRA